MISIFMRMLPREKWFLMAKNLICLIMLAYAPLTQAATTPPCPYLPQIEEVAREQQIDAQLLYAVVHVESACNPMAVSSKGARGLMQVLPETAHELGNVNLFDPKSNLTVGSRYLKLLLQQFDQNLPLALAAYNAGPAAVEHYGRQLPPYLETHEYVKKVLAHYHNTGGLSEGALHHVSTRATTNLGRVGQLLEFVLLSPGHATQRADRRSGTLISVNR